MIKYITLIALFISSVFLFSCSDSTKPDTNEFVIKGKLSNTKSETIYLEELLINKTQIIDSTKLNEEGEFYFKKMIKEPGFYMVRVKNRNFITLVIKSEETIEISGDALKLEKTYKIKGSDDCAQIQEMYKRYYINSSKVDSLRNVYLASQVRTDFEQFTRQLDSSYQVIFLDQQKYMRAFIAKNKSSLVSLLALYQTFGQKRIFSADDEITYADMIDKELFKQYPRNKHVISLHERVSELKRNQTEQKLMQQRLAIGAIAPDFSIKTIKGDTLKLSSLRGKTVLLNFWTPRCEDCVGENTRMKIRYEKYGPKGFDIVSIAVEENEELWKKAVTSIDMKWHQGNDLLGLNSPLLTLYNLSDNFPYNIILDPNGRIIAKGLQSDSLYVKIRSLFVKDTSAGKQ